MSTSMKSDLKPTDKNEWNESFLNTLTSYFSFLNHITALLMLIQRPLACPFHKSVGPI